MLMCKTGPLHVKRESLTQHAAKDSQLQQQEQKGGLEADIYKVRGAGKLFCMSSCVLCKEKSCMTT